MRKADVLAMRSALLRRIDLAEHQLAYITGARESERRARLEGYIQATRETLRALEETKSARLTP